MRPVHRHGGSPVRAGCSPRGRDPGSPGFGVLQPIALALGLDDPAPVGEPVESGAGEALRSEDLGPGLEGQIARDDQTGALVRGGYDVEEKLGADLGGRDVAQLIKNKKVQLGNCPLRRRRVRSSGASMRVVTSSVVRKNRTR